MKTSLEKIQEDFQVPIEIGLEGIAKGGSVLPSITTVGSNEVVTEVTLCDSISGGADEIFNMPRRLSLVRYKYIDGTLHEFRGEYTLTKNSPE